MRLSHKRKVSQKQKSMICGVFNWNKSIFKPGPWVEGHCEASMELKPAPDATYYRACRLTRKIYTQGFFFGKKAVAA